MPLEHGSSREAFSHNVREMMKAGHPQAQAVAAAYREAGKDRKANDMSPTDWRGLIHGLLRFFMEEAQEPEHAEDDASGKLNEQEEGEAAKTAKEREEQPEHVFLEPSSRKYPVKVKRDGEWKYDRDLLLAAARRARMNDLESLAEKADAIRKEEFGGAQDSAVIALDDTSTVRHYDADGRLHVESTPISKAVVNEYWGREIPGAEQLGLNLDRKYRLLRHPNELRKAADTFNNLPLLRRHVPVSAGDHRPEDVVGSTGTDAAFEHPYLTNSLVVWAKDDIADIERDLKKELSCAYRYRADMTPGTYEGEPYDGVMRDLIGNHVAIVKEGRAGPDVVVGDSKENLENLNMTKSALARKKAFDALTAFFSPKLAKDQKIDGLDAVLLALDESEEDKKDDKEEAKDKKAKDAEAAPEKRPSMDKGAKDRKAKDAAEELKEKLKDKMKAEDWKAACDDIDGMMSAEDEDDEDERPDPEKTNSGDKAKDKKAKDEDVVDKKAMDAAIETRVSASVAAERQRQRDVREAEKVVRPWVGDLAIAYDSAEDVYGAALESLGIKTKGVHPSAYRTILEREPKPGIERRGAKPRIAMDASKNTAASLEAICGPGVNAIHLNP